MNMNHIRIDPQMDKCVSQVQWLVIRPAFKHTVTTTYYKNETIKQKSIEIVAKTIDRHWTRMPYRIHNVAKNKVVTASAISPDGFAAICENWCPIQDDRMNQRIANPYPKYAYIEQCCTLRWLIEGRVLKHRLGWTHFIENADGKWRQCREKYIVQTDCPALINNLTRPSRINGKPEFDHIQTHVLIKTVQNQFAHSAIVPGSMHQQQSQ